ncbi:MAG: peptidoglycan-binding domain-containing protein, partial [Gammaproteobacteria bacterium]
EHTMRKMLTSLALTLASVVVFSGASLAADFSCKKEINVTGTGAFTEEGGKKKAIKVWRDAAIAGFGFYYGDEKTANEGLGVVVERCARSSIGLMICQAKGRPCVAQTGNDLECTRNDSKDCDPKAKWIQSQLDKRGYDVGSVDGALGPKSERAIRKFKKDNHIAEDAPIEAVIDALKK